MQQEMTAQQTPLQELISLKHGRDVAELLRDLYVEQGWSQERIARYLGTSRLTVAMWLRVYGISRDMRGAA